MVLLLSYSELLHIILFLYSNNELKNTITNKKKQETRTSHINHLNGFNFKSVGVISIDPIKFANINSSKLVPKQ